MSIEYSTDPRDIVIRPIITEKSSILMDYGKYTFEVDKRSNKTQIKIAIEQLFPDIKVRKVSTMNLKGKNYRRRNGIGRRKDIKKAIVTLEDGAIDVFR